MKFRNPKHAMICKTYVITTPYKLSNRCLAAVYLLSANKETWLRARHAIKGNRIDFSELPKTGLDTYQYAIVSAAPDLCEDTRHITLYDVGDRNLMEYDLYDLIMSALHICRDGYRALGVNRTFN